MQLNPHQPKNPSSNLEPGLPLLIGTSTGGRSPDRESVERFSTFSRRGEVQYEFYDPSDPRSIIQYGEDEDGEPIYLSDEQDALILKAKRLCNRLGKSLNLYESAEPRQWVELAYRKDIVIPWLAWANSRGYFLQDDVADGGSTDPVEENTVFPDPQWHLMATPERLITAFGQLTDMNRAWFNTVQDKPRLRDARQVLGVGGHRSVEPLFDVFKVMQWLIDPKRKTGKRIKQETGWRLLKEHFPKVYDHYEQLEPDQD